MAKIAIVDQDGSLHPLAFALTKYGDDVVYWVTGTGKTKIGDGLVTKVNSIEEIVKFKPSVTMANDPRKVGSLQSEHISAFGVTPIAMKLVDDPLYAASLVDSLGISVPITLNFNNPNDALEYVKDIKPGTTWKLFTDRRVDGKAAYTLKSKDHIRTYIKFEDHIKKAKTFTLQESIDGIEISVSGWFNHKLPSRWYKPFISSLNSNESYSLQWHWMGQSPKLFKQTLDKLTRHLTKIEYTGWIEGRFVIEYKTRKVYFLNFTFDLNWAAFALCYGSTVSKFLQAVGDGASYNPSIYYTFIASRTLMAPLEAEMPAFAPLQEDGRLYPCDVYL